MIVEAVVKLLVSAVAEVFGMFGHGSAPGWVTGISDKLGQLVDSGASLGTWVPWNVFGYAMTAIGAALGVSLAVRVARIALSLFTGGGGSAA